MHYPNLEPPVLALDFDDVDGEPRVIVTRAGYTMHWRWGEPVERDGFRAWNVTTEKNDHGKAGSIHGVAGAFSQQAGDAGAGEKSPSPVQPGQASGAPEAGTGADSLAAIFERLLRHANQRAFVSGFTDSLTALARENINRQYGKFASDPRVKAALAWDAIPDVSPLPPLPSLPPLPGLPPIGACPCLHCTMERAFADADKHFAAELEAQGSAILFIELGGKPKS